MKRLVFVLTVAGLLTVFAGGALAQMAPQGTEQTAIQQGTLNLKNLDDPLGGAATNLEEGQATAQATTGETLDANNLGVTPTAALGFFTYWTGGQTFIAEHSGALTSVEIPLTTMGSPTSDLSVQIVNVDPALNYLPAEPEDVLATATIPQSELTTSPSFGEMLASLRIEKVNFDAPASVVAGSHYALILKAQGEYPSMYVAGGTALDDTYLGGTRIFRYTNPAQTNPSGWQPDSVGSIPELSVPDMSFAIYTSTDTMPPEVSSTSPSNYATGVAATANISATFFEEGSGIDPDTLTTNTFKVVQVKPTGNVRVSGIISYDNSSKTVTFDPSSSLAKGLYKATLTTGVKDEAGNALANNYTWRFTTVGPSKK